MVNRVERHQINRKHILFNKIDDLALKSKNLYNNANYHLRQVFIITTNLKEGKELNNEQTEFLNYINSKVNQFNIFKESNLKESQVKAKENLNNPNLSEKEKETLNKIINKKFKPLNYFGADHKYLGYDFLEFIMKKTSDYKSLMAQAAQQILRLLDKSWVSFFESIKDYKINSGKYKGRPKLPKYKHKTKGRFNIVFTNQNVKHKNDVVILPLCLDQYNIKTKMKGKLQQVRINPANGIYLLEVVYKKELHSNTAELNLNNMIAVDLGVTNFATIVNNIGLPPIIIKGNYVKTVNQYYNKKKAELQSKLEFVIVNNKKVQLKISNRINSLTNKRNNIMNDFMHKASKTIISYCLLNSIGTVIIGKNQGWKQNAGLGKLGNQKFTSIPYNRFIEKLSYKAGEIGINVIVNEESYTFKASFIDNDDIPIFQKDDETVYTFSGKRIYRGIYKSKGGLLIHSDVNGAANILRKQNNSFKYVKNMKLTPLKIDIIKMHLANSVA